MNWLRQILFFLVGFYLIVVFLAYLFQAKLLFFPDSRKLSECQGAKQLGFQIIDNQYGNQAVRFLLKTDPLARANIIIFHGNASSACNSLPYYLEMKDLRLNFIIASYPGYEGDHRKPGQEVFLKNGEALVDYLKSQNYGHLPMILFGESLGTGVATYLASVRPANGLILKSPYTSISEIGAFHYPFLPIYLINQNVFPAYIWAPAVKCSVLVLHGTDDQTIPIKFGQKQAGFFKSQVRFVAIQGAGHNDILNLGDRIIWKEVGDFINRVIPSIR
ncbi:MAG TPA: alpha/beta hydrolase [Nitrospiria bacterium]|nr:alpha/beta hydrolase [Nitrospiria bacterium]